MFWRPPYIAYPLNLPLLFLLPCFFFWLNALFNALSNMLFYLMIQQTCTCGALVLEASCCVFYATRHQVYSRFDINHMVFVSTLIWYHTPKQVYTQHTLRHIKWHKYILKPPIICSHRLSITLDGSLTNIKNLHYRGPQYLCFSKITHLQKSQIY